MKRNIYLTVSVFCLFLLLLAKGCGSTGDNTPGQEVFTVSANVLYGYVNWSETGTALSGVTVSLKNASNSVVASTSTDSGGNYQIMGIYPGSYSLSFEKSGWATSSQFVTFLENSERKEVNVSLSVAQTFDISGMVVDKASPTVGLEGAQVEVNSTVAAFSNSAGSFTMKLSAGTAIVSVSKQFYTEFSFLLVVNSDGTTSPASMTIELEKNSGIIQGQTLNQATGNGANNILIDLVPSSTDLATPSSVLTATVAGVDGIFSIESQEGAYTLKATSDNFMPYTESINIIRDTTSSISITLSPTTTTITGTVRDKSNGNTIENAVITTDVGPGAVSDASGSYTITGLPQEVEVAIIVAKGSYAQTEISITPGKGEILRVVDATLELVPTAISFAGTVTFTSGYVESEFSAGAGLTVDIVQEATATSTGYFVLYFPGAEEDKLINFTGVVREKQSKKNLLVANYSFTNQGTAVITVP
ncbi:carboxypeptidase regulatory-like domain-containing protein [Candidatus Riflebacteria bacterium]